MEGKAIKENSHPDQLAEELSPLNLSSQNSRSTQNSSMMNLLLKHYLTGKITL